MSAERSKLQEQLDRAHQGVHARCVVCGFENGRGLHAPFRVLPDGSVEAEFACDDDLEGYPHMLHGGVIASLLDGAMTNCLFAHGITAVTAELTVRYHTTVPTGRPAIVRASIDRSSHGCHFLTAELRRDGRVAVTAHGKFLSNEPRPRP
jgi:acyl-coenzyme A thioesterase PaaI-like protein